MKVALDRVSKRFGLNRVLNSLDLELPEGAIVAVVGINGAGKTTLLHCLAGFLSLNGGSVTFDGEHLRRDRIDLRRRFMFLPDFPAFALAPTLIDYLGVVLRAAALVLCLWLTNPVVIMMRFAQTVRTHGFLLGWVLFFFVLLALSLSLLVTVCFFEPRIVMKFGWWLPGGVGGIYLLSAFYFWCHQRGRTEIVGR